MMRCRLKRPWSPGVPLLLLAACSSVSHQSADLEQRITFPRAQPRTVLPSGSVSFQLSRALAQGEQVVCAVNGASRRSCLSTASEGAIRYEDLTPGPHRLAVEITAADGAVKSRAQHAFELTTPSVAVNGATPAGIAAAIAAARSGHSAAILERTSWVGGMMSGGLAETDTGVRGAEIIGGIAVEFFDKVRAAEADRGACAKPCEAWDFEPQIAERVFEEMLSDAGVIVERGAHLLDVRKEGAVIRTVTTSRGDVSAKIFIDASYEGDLMALAGVPYRLGREPRQLANPPDDAAQLALQEDHAGAQRYRVPLGVHVDPYRVRGDRSSGTLPFIEPKPDVLPTVGEGDSRVMAYTYRLCVTDDPANRIRFERPDDYDPARYEASARVALAVRQNGADLAERMFNPARTVRSRSPGYYKYDLNGGSTFSIDMTAPDLNQAYVEADEAERERIRRAYRSYIRGLLYFWRTDPRFGGLNEKIARFGYCADEFVDRGNWPHQLYVRAARRMTGEYTMNENDVLQNGRRPPIADPVGFGAYVMDTHTVRYFAAPVEWPDGSRKDALVLEGFSLVPLPDHKPYPISYRSLIPQAKDSTNLLNPVTVSATHLAYSSIRMEPTFMILGEGAGTAAALALEHRQSVQAVSYDRLRKRLLASRQRLTD